MGGPYDLDGRKSVVECLLRDISRDSSSKIGLYEPMRARAIRTLQESELAIMRRVFRSNTPYGQALQARE